LTPHTIRRSPAVPFWEIAPRQIADLIEAVVGRVSETSPRPSGAAQPTC
jgi:hypothetical protein